MKGFVIAGTGSGVGKTTVTASVLAAFCQRGLKVQAFKSGPDYIDPAHHAILVGRPAYNLDTWMLPAEVNRSIFREATRDCDVAVVEGAMGLFDGVDGRTNEGSTADVACLLGLPVVLVVDASNAARSVAAAVKGFREFDPGVSFIGVILNRVAGEAHAKVLEDAIRDVGMSALGWLPDMPSVRLQERHLGLVVAGERSWSVEQIRSLANTAERHISLGTLLNKCEIPGNFEPTSACAHKSSVDQVRIGVARDNAFCFYYESSLQALRDAGAQLVQVSPLSDAKLPENLDGLYIGGGYPELYAGKLSRNESLLDSLREFAGSGHPVYAECGGLMYLAQKVMTLEKQWHQMAGLLPLVTEMSGRLQDFGYCEIELMADCLIGRQGTTIRGHSFHCSHATEIGEVQQCYRVRRLLTGDHGCEGYSVKNVLASYVHLDFAGNKESAESFVHSCRDARSNA